MSTLASKIEKDDYLSNENIVKVQTKDKLDKSKLSFAKKFSRHLSYKEKNIYHHIGIYQFKVSTLENFINLNQSENEKKYKLEQLRALDNNININVSYASSKGIGIDTIEDYMELKKIMEYKK